MKSRTASEWRQDGNLAIIRNQMYDAFGGDALLLTWMRVSTIFNFQELVERNKNKFTTTTKNELKKFLKKEIKTALKELEYKNYTSLVDDLSTGRPIEIEKKPSSLFFTPSKKFGFHSTNDKTIDGVPGLFLDTTPGETPEKFKKLVERLKSIEEKTEASNYAFILLSSLLEHFEWLSDKKITFNQFKEWYQLLSSKIDHKSPLSTKVKTAWHHYWKRLRKKTYSRLITDNELPLYFRIHILLQLKRKLANGTIEESKQAQIKEFIKRESKKIKSTPSFNMIKVIFEKLQTDPFMSKEEIFTQMQHR
jgi:hypothetical protein